MNSRNITWIVIAAIVVIAIIGITVWKGDMVAQAQNLCFQSTVSNGQSSSTTSIKANLKEDHTVEGTLSFLPSDKDKMEGTFTGTWASNDMTTTLRIKHTYIAEGVAATEDRIIVINGSMAQIDWDAEGTLAISLDQIPQVNCETGKPETNTNRPGVPGGNGSNTGTNPGSNNPGTSPIGTTTVKTYMNNVFAFTLTYPGDFVLNSSSIDKATSESAGLSNGTAKLELTRKTADPERNQKIELTLAKSTQAEQEFLNDHRKEELLAKNDLTWYFSEGTNGQSGRHIVAVAYHEGVILTMKGYDYDGSGRSTYSDEVKKQMIAVMEDFVTGVNFGIE